jgi:hypothetical protein
VCPQLAFANAKKQKKQKRDNEEEEEEEEKKSGGLVGPKKIKKEKQEGKRHSFSKSIDLIDPAPPFDQIQK